MLILFAIWGIYFVVLLKCLGLLYYLTPTITMYKCECCL